MTFESLTGTGSLAHYGPRVTNQKYGGALSAGDGSKRAIWTFDFDDLPVNAENGIYATIPANAYIVSATITVLTAMDGTLGTLTVGLEQADGTVIDVDGIDAAVAQAALVANAVIRCDGALVTQAADIGDAAGQLLVTTGGTVTAGKFEVAINYHVQQQVKQANA